MKHGQTIPGDVLKSRWCTVCKMAHGSLYVCEHYPAKLRAKLTDEGIGLAVAIQRAMIERGEMSEFNVELEIVSDAASHRG